MSLKKKIIFGIIAVVLLIQFIRPETNSTDNTSKNDIELSYYIPSQTIKLLKNSCYDCHSNSSKYPWYFKIQPIAWWMSSHTEDAKKELNFNEFGSYSKTRQRNKLKGIASSVSEGSMPLPSYTLLHANAKLSTEQKALIKTWALNLRDSI